MTAAGGRQKIAILGGGVGAMTTAFALTDQEGGQEHYDITVYQMGWRLGGKCASGHNSMLLAWRVQHHDQAIRAETARHVHRPIPIPWVREILTDIIWSVQVFQRTVAAAEAVVVDSATGTATAVGLRSRRGGKSQQARPLAASPFTVGAFVLKPCPNGLYDDNREGDKDGVPRRSGSFHSTQPLYRDGAMHLGELAASRGSGCTVCGGG